MCMGTPLPIAILCMGEACRAAVVHWVTTAIGGDRLHSDLTIRLGFGANTGQVLTLASIGGGMLRCVPL